MGAIERAQRRHFAGEFLLCRLGKRQMGGQNPREHVMLCRLRAKFLRGLTGGYLSCRIALQNGQGSRVGRTIWTSTLGLAPAARLMMVFHMSSADVISPRSSANARTARVVATTTISPNCSR